MQPRRGFSMNPINPTPRRFDPSPRGHFFIFILFFMDGWTTHRNQDKKQTTNVARPTLLGTIACVPVEREEEGDSNSLDEEGSFIFFFFLLSFCTSFDVHVGRPSDFLSIDRKNHRMVHVVFGSTCTFFTFLLLCESRHELWEANVNEVRLSDGSPFADVRRLGRVVEMKFPTPFFCTILFDHAFILSSHVRCMASHGSSSIRSRFDSMAKEKRIESNGMNKGRMEMGRWFALSRMYVERKKIQSIIHLVRLFVHA